MPFLCILQALAAAMRELQREWWLVVVQLDHLHRLGQLSLASLVYYCREPAASMQLLASIAVSRLQLYPVGIASAKHVAKLLRS
jgi:hypothetical protein